MKTPGRPKLPRLFDEDHLRAYAHAVGLSGEHPVEVRIIRAKFLDGNWIGDADRYTSTIAGYFDRVDALVADVYRVIDRPVYVTANPVSTALLARAENRLIKARNTARDEDIPRLRRLLVDIDPIRPADISATDEELAAGLATRDRILADHPEIRASSFWGCSGNGAFLVPSIDLPNDGESNDLVARFLAALAALYTDERVKVDPATKNPARIMALPGTMKCKGTHRPDRPWRLVTLDSPHGQATLPLDIRAWLERVGPLLPPPAPAHAVAPRGGRAAATFFGDASHPPALDHLDAALGRPFALKALADEAATVAAAPQGGRNNQLNKSAYKLAGYLKDGLLSRAEIEHTMGLAAVQAGLSADEIGPTIASALEKGLAAPRDTSRVASVRRGVEAPGAAGAAEANGVHAPAYGPGTDGVPAFDPSDGEAPQGGGGEPERKAPDVDAAAVAAKAERMAADDAARIEALYRDREFLAQVARLEIADPAEAEAVKATLKRLDGFRQRAFDAVMAEHRLAATREAERLGNGPRDYTAEFEFSDLGNGRRLVAMYGHAVRYCKVYGDWMVNDGKRWAIDHKYVTEAMAQEVPGRILAETPPTRSPEVIEGFRKWALLSQSKDRLLAMLATARSMVSVQPGDLDRNPWLLNVQNGTLDLRDGGFRPHAPADLITKVANVAYDPGAACPTWDRFILDVMLDDASVAEYLQRAVGYSITGVIREHVFFFLYGNGRNGKGTFLNTIFHVLGDYANQIDSDLLIAQNLKQHPTGLTELEGRRFVSADESENNPRLAEGVVKKLTGGNPIQARRMRENFYTFWPSHHLFYAANHKPEIRDMSAGMWRRLKLIPFEACFDETKTGGRKPDLDLEQKLRAEAPGILNWMLAGCVAWQAVGLAEPARVKEGVEEYREEQDETGWYIDERIAADDQARTRLSDLYADYKWWCDRFGKKALSVRRFSGELESRGFHTKKSNSVVWKDGCRLKTAVELASGPDPFLGRNGVEIPKPAYGTPGTSYAMDFG